MNVLKVNINQLNASVATGFHVRSTLAFNGLTKPECRL